MDNKIYFDSQEFRELLKNYEESKKNNKSIYLGIEDLFDILNFYLYQGEIEEAVEVYTLAKSLHPDSPETIKMDIRILLAKDEAETALIRIADLGFPDEEDSKLLQAQVFIALKEFGEARQMALDVLNQENVTKEGFCEALEIMLDGGFTQEVLALVVMALHKDRDDKSLLEIKAECYIEMQKIDKAIEIYNDMLDAEPYSTFYWEQLGRVYYMANRYGKALECFEYELAIDNNIDYAHIMKAYCYYFMRDYKSAGKIFSVISDKYPSSVPPRFYKALCLWHEGCAKEALALFEDIVEQIEDKEENIETMLARINQAIILSKMGEKERAARVVSLALLMRPDNMRQLLVGDDEELYNLRDKENPTFKEMNVMDIKEWSTEEELTGLATHLIKYKHYEMAKSVLLCTRRMSKDPADIDARLAFTTFHLGEEDKFRKFAENAIKGKSCLLFELFGLVYDAKATVDSILDKIKK